MIPTELETIINTANPSARLQSGRTIIEAAMPPLANGFNR